MGVVVEPEDEVLYEGDRWVRLVAYNDTEGWTWFGSEHWLELLPCGPPPWGDQTIPPHSFAGALAAAERRGFTHVVTGEDVEAISRSIKNALLLSYDPAAPNRYYMDATPAGRAEIRLNNPVRSGQAEVLKDGHVCWLERRPPSVWERLRRPIL